MESTSHLKAGAIVGDYKLLEKIGEGKAGAVFLATPLKEKPFAAAGQPVALKMYKPEILARSNESERIRRELDASTAARHPHVVTAYEVGTPKTGETFLVMQFVDGLPMSLWVQMYPEAPPRLLLRLLKDLISGIGALHDHGIIHRDIKPANILVTPDFRVKLMDLGVVKLSGAVKDTNISGSDEFLGTIRNSAPEHLETEDVDFRADLYSFGTVLSHDIARVCTKFGIYIHQPRIQTDPRRSPDLSPEVVYSIDRRRVTSARLLLGLLNHPSFGVGQEIEIAGAYGVPTLLVYRKGAHISRMVTGRLGIRT